MKRIFSMLCVLALMLGMIAVPAYASEAKSVLQGENLVLTANAENLTVEADSCVDLNGYSIAGVTVADGATLYVCDSQTDDYTVADGIYGSVTGISGNVQAAEGYVAITGEGAVSYHKADLTLTSMSLRPTEAGVYYNSAFAADEVVAAKVETYGVALSVVAEPTAENLNSLCGYSTFRGFEAGEKAGTLLTGVMNKNNIDYTNNRNANMAIYGSAYIEIDGQYTFGACAKRSLKEQIQLIDAVFGTLNATQKAAIVEMFKTYKSVMSGWALANIQEASTGVLAGDVEIKIPVSVEDGKVTEEITVEQDGVTITIPMGALVETDELTLTVTLESETDVTASEGQSLLPLDVHVEGLSEANTAPLTIDLGKVLPENLNLGNYTAYHSEESGANEMTLVAADEEFTAHNQFKYTLDGEVTLHVASFSLFTLRTVDSNIWNGERDYSWYTNAIAKRSGETIYEIRNADQLAGFGAIVGGMAEGIKQDSFSGKTVKLLSNIDLGDAEASNVAGKIFHPIGYYYNGDSSAPYSTVYSFEGTFDGNGHTVANFYQNTWEIKGDYDGNYYKDAMGLFGYVINGTVKNLTVKNFSSDGEYTPTGVIAAYAVNSTFENIALTNCNPRVYNTGNGGIVGIGGLDTDPDTYHLTFTNITIDNSNKITALWGSWDVACGGLVGMFRGAGHANMNNCHVAAQIDVYNDVCGNYQYYWYRYAGMMIGTNKTMVTDANGYTVPETSKFHAEDCTVHFGDWNNYYYCELVANSLASYTHDHQFSRLTEIKSIDEIKTDETWTKTGNFVLFTDSTRDTTTAECFHIVKAEDGSFVRHSHEDAGTEVVNGNTVLKEDNQIIYLPFNQLFTGYGWGVKHIPVYNGEDYAFEGITILDREVADSVVKFEKAENAEDSFASGTTITIGELFKAIDNAEVAIVGANVQVAVSPADETSTAGGTYVANANDWTKGTLTFSGMGNATVTITDYYFCAPTIVNIEIDPVAMIGEVGYATLQDALDAVEDGGTITLQANVAVSEYLDVYTANFGATERSITLNLNGNTIAPAANYNYKWYPLIFVGINQTLTIKNGTVQADEHTAIGVYGTLNLENVNVVKESGTEEAVCIWNWSEGDDYYQDCQYLLTGSATITGGTITGGILVEGPVSLNETASFDKLYLNTKTGHGKYILPNGYGLVKENGYYTKLHAHIFENGVCTVCGLSTSYVETNIADIGSTDTVIITMSKGGTTWALTNANGASKAPDAVEVTVVNGVITSERTDILWNINNVNDILTIYPNGEDTKYLYCINGNNGVRVGTGVAKHFVIDGDYLKIAETNEVRYLGVYVPKEPDTPDWRCYTNTTGNIAGQSLAFYVLETSCEHENWENRSAVAATCTVTGRNAGKYCLACDSYISGGEITDAVGHDFELTDTKEATCTEKGKNTYHCTVCNKVKTETIKAEHAWDEGVIDPAPTCNDAGTCTYTCGVCGETKTEAVEAAGHTAGEEVTENEVANSCTTDGSYDTVVYCTVCNAEISRVTHTVSAAGHTEVTDAPVAPDCVNTGLTEGKHCSVCGVVTVAQQTVPALGHTDGEAVTENEVAATCTVDGSYDTVTYCTVCGVETGRETSTVPAAGHTEGKAVIENKIEATCTVEGSYDTVVYCTVCISEISRETTTVAATGHTYEDGECECGATCSWKLVTDANDLTVGDQIVIVAKDYNYAMSTTQNGNNRGQASVTKSGTTITFGADVQTLTLKTGTVDGTFAFYTGSGYLYAASSGSNHLKTQSTNNANGSWKIEIGSTGVATIKAQGSNTRNWLRYNSTNNPPIFSAYGSGQADVVIYKLTVCMHVETKEVATVAATCTTPGATAGVRCVECEAVISGCEEIAALGHTEVVDKAVAATCTATGLTEGKHCSVCSTVIVAQTVTKMTDHNYDNDTCTVCGDQKDVGATEVKELAAFTFPVSGKSGHQDGSDYNGTKFESGKYSLVFTNYSKVYYKANDALGKGCIKFGTGSAAGSLKFEVPENVTKVVIHLAKYKSNTSKVNINGTAYTLTKNSNDGEYDAIEIDTSETKTITITTVSGGYRMMMNTIEFWGTEQ